MEEIKDESSVMETASEMEDSDSGWAEAARARQKRRDEALMAASSSREAVHNRARKLKQHYREVEACNNIMAYGFIIIILLLTGFYWFIIIFSAEIKDTFQDHQVIAPAFVYGTVALALLNFVFR